jgi:capsular exopolysaccharide synthesis family protein
LNQTSTEKGSRINTAKNASAVSQHPSNNLKEYANIIRANIFPIILIFLASILVTVLYVINAADIYRTATSLKIVKPQGNILTAQIIPEFQDWQGDRFISNEIEILKSLNIRERVAYALLDSFKINPNKAKYFYILNKNPEIKSETVSAATLSIILGKITSVAQKRGLDIAEIEVLSPSNYEAQLIANVYARIYLEYSIDFARRELTNLKNFLEEEKSKKSVDLNNSESAIQDYQQKGGILFLDDQAKNLVEQISTFEAEKNSAEIELATKQRAFTEIKSELEKTDKSLPDYIEGQINSPFLIELQKKIAELETQKKLDIVIPKEQSLIDKVRSEYDKKLIPLKKEYDDRVEIFKKGILASNPEEKSKLSNLFLETNIDVQSKKAKYNSLNKLLGKYETEFSKLPSQSIELARLERARKSNEKLYLALEEKYQEALVNERAQLGNVNIIDAAILPLSPSKPNRQLIIIIGAMIGLSLGVGFAFLRNYLDRSIKNPDDIESRGIPVLSWVPSIEELKELGSSQLEFIVANKPNATASESFKALRTRVMYSKIESELKIILITSSVPAEGKTTVSLNLAGSFAQSNKKVLLLDADLRKPRVHAIFESERFPGLSDYLFSNVTFNEIIRETKLKNMYYITSGTIPPNPSELLGSQQMFDFLQMLKKEFDVILLDSPPFISVTDAEILSRISDGTILVVQANKTPVDAFLKTYQRIVDIDSHKFLGSVLNNFRLKSAYGYYYNYYYYYSKPDGLDKRRSKQVKKS